MFTVPRVNVIESDDGFSVEVLGRTGLLYVEGARKLHVDSEVLNYMSIAILRNSILNWDSPYDYESIDDNKRDVIIDNIRRAFDSQGTQIQVE